MQKQEKNRQRQLQFITPEVEELKLKHLQDVEARRSAAARKASKADTPPSEPIFDSPASQTDQAPTQYDSESFLM